MVMWGKISPNKAKELTMSKPSSVLQQDIKPVAPPYDSLDDDGVSHLVDRTYCARSDDPSWIYCGKGRRHPTLSRSRRRAERKGS